MKKILLILSFLMSFNSFAQNKKSFLRDGNTLYTDSSYKEAEIQYRKSLKEDPDYFNASFNLADAVYKQERYEESSALFDALIDNVPAENDLAKVYHNLGNSLVKEQKLVEAISAYKSALRINPEDKDTRHNLALTTQQEQEQEENKDEQKEDKEGENKEEEKKKNEQEKEQENKEQQEENKENKPEEKKEEMSKEDAEKMLEAIQQEEKELQKELQKKKVKGKRVKVLKDW